MKISTILDHVDSGHMALPEFQRGYVWNANQVRGLMDSLYRRHPIGSLLVWATESDTARHRGDGNLAPGIVKLLLDGQQRITSLYGIIRGEPPRFFDGNARAFTGLHFHLDKEEFGFWQPVKMRDDPLWIDVSSLMKAGYDGIDEFVAKLAPSGAPGTGKFYGRLNRILGIRDVDLHIEEVTGGDKTVDVVVDIFNRVNSGGTTLSKGDLALAKICAEWPEGRDRMRAALHRWRKRGFDFKLDWLLRNVNTIVTGEAKFSHLHEVAPEKVKEGLARAETAIDNLLNLIGGRLGLDHDRVLFGQYAFPVMTHYISRRGGVLNDAVEQDKLLFWYVQSALWGRFSGSTETIIDQDLRQIEELDAGLDRLIRQLAVWHGGLRVLPEHFSGWSMGARFYPMLYLLSRVCDARDWGLGLSLNAHMLGRMNRLEVHHIFPRSVLYKAGYRRADVNAVANYCFLTKESNLQISDRRPEVYFPEIEDNHPGALKSQWIPMDRSLWRVDRYLDFLEARRSLLAQAANGFLGSLAHGADEPAAAEALVPSPATPGQVAEAADAPPPGVVDSDKEEQLLTTLNEWVAEQGLPEGEYLYELADPETGQPLAVLDLAWPEGLQEGLSQPVAVLINETQGTLDIANAHGYRYFTSAVDFCRYVEQEILAGAQAGDGSAT